jgi:hypothetical protein
MLLVLPELAKHRTAQEVLTALAQAGVMTVGQLGRLSEESLRRRFGRLGDILLTLAAGYDVAPFRPERLASWLGVRLHLAPPATAEQLTASLDQLAELLARHLAQRQQAGCTLELGLWVDGGAPLRQRHALVHPMSRASALAEQACRLLHALLHAPQAAQGADASASERYTHLQLRMGELCAAVPDQAHFWTLPPHRERAVRVQRLRAALAPLALRYDAPPLLHARCVSPHAVLPEARYALVEWAADSWDASATA